jgi:hypothetical protein
LTWSAWVSCVRSLRLRVDLGYDPRDLLKLYVYGYRL